MRLIDADAFFSEFGELDKEPYNNAPTVDPIKHGHWNEEKDRMLWCSVCTSTAPYEADYWGYVINAPRYDYCPNCGAKMDEVEE